ncbi:MAG TPA: LysR substrate-binding domain-containing protein [Polyangiaceae bacterium]|nr:LysR substrate-binding domain-containing protein [Polyangiaceae bacterium]
MRYTLRQLEVFLAVARGESVSRAGKELHLSQSAVSSALADLERQLDVSLFDRVGKKLRLSDTGRALRARALRVYDEARELDQAFGSSAADALRIGATLTVGNHVVPPLIARYLGEDPSRRATLHVENTEAIAAKVRNLEIDVGLVEGEVAHADLDITAFRDDELVVFASPSHPLAKRRSLGDDELRSAPWVLRERGSGTRQVFERAMTGLVPELRVVLEVQQPEAILGAVRAGLGLGCLSRITLEDPFKLRTLVPLRVRNRTFERKLYLVLHRKKLVGAGLTRFLEICRE